MDFLSRIGGMHQLLADFVNHMDAALGKGQSYRPITGFPQQFFVDMPPILLRGCRQPRVFTV